tara:strand:- start:141 stop:560 length:420 start_codon:yes stop_codon:yes gene_type:complete
MRKQRLNTSLFLERPHHTSRYFGGGAPIIMGGTTDAEMERRLNESALENERMLAQAADEQMRLQAELDQRDEDMALQLKQTERANEANMAKAQKALDVELDSLGDSKNQDDLAADFSAIEQALASGLGGNSSGSDVRPL